MAEAFEPKVIAFCCHYCAYSAADLAGSMRLEYAPNVRISKLMCSGKVDTLHILKAFEEAIASAPSVVSCHLMSGEDDYLVTVLARDLADFERIHKEQLSRLPGVVRLKSSFALRNVANKPLPASCLLPSRK